MTTGKIHWTVDSGDRFLKKILKALLLSRDPVSLKAVEHILRNNSLSDSLAVARQFYPSKKENVKTPGFSNDPMGEFLSRGSHDEFIHKYPDKILILTTRHCAVLCRFCTRKRITYKKTDLPITRFSHAVHYIKKNPQIKEIIFSGGDPFLLPDSLLKETLDMFLSLPDIKKIRFHSRMPTIKPSRFNQEFFNMLFSANHKKLTLRLVAHINHPSEITPHSEEVFQKFKNAGIEILCQSVLLRRINDSKEKLSRLIKKLSQTGIRPYYLHQLDRVQGSAHFEVLPETGLSILTELKKEIPQCLMPLYVQDGPLGKQEIKENFSYGDSTAFSSAGSV